jgi:pyruvate formate lyase activating enzyme
MGAQDTAGALTARIFDIQRFSIHDGPGIRTTVFFKGCPLHCAWCQNPESQSPDPQLMLYPRLCLGCGACVPVCPEAESRDPGGRPARCLACGACVEVCPSGARRIAGREMGLEEIAEKALRDEPFYGTDGGVTLGGGEPLAQHEAAFALADMLRGRGCHVALDTSCMAPRAVLDAVPDHFDLVLADLKAVTPGLHREWTGGDNAGVLDALRAWTAALADRLWISVPVVPGVHHEDELARIADFVADLAPTPCVRILPFHRLGESKYAALGEEVPEFVPEVEPLVDAVRQAMAERGVVVRPA